MYVPDSQERNEGARRESRDSERLPLNDPNQRPENETTSISSQPTSGQQASGNSDSPDNVQDTQPEFLFIEVDRFGKPHGAKMKKFVHANARRRGTPRKQPSVPRTAPRQIRSKHVQSRPRTQLEAPGELALGSASMRSNLSGSIPFRQSPSASGIPRLHRREAFGNLDPNEALVPFGTLLPPQEPRVTVATGPLFGMSVTPDFDRWQSRDSNTPYCLFMVAGAPVLYMQARTWPFPYPLRGGPKPKTSLWMSETPIPAPDVHARRTCLNRTSQPVAFITQSAEYFMYKGETMRWISNQLSNHQMGDRDSIIGVILCLTMWEIGRSYSRESAQHMKGIARIVNLRGGLDKLEASFQIKILLADIYVAVVTNDIPLFRGSRLVTPRPPPLPILGLGELSIPDSPLYQCGKRRLDSVLLHSNFCPSTIRVLQHMTDLTNAFSSDRSTLDALLADDLFILSPAIDRPSELFRIIQSTAIIYRAAFLLPPTPLSSPLNHQFVTSIVHILSSPDHDETWVRFPGILLWIILTGTVAAYNHPERAFFIHFYGKIISVARWQWWDEIIGAFETFLPVRRIADERRG